MSDRRVTSNTLPGMSCEMHSASHEHESDLNDGVSEAHNLDVDNSEDGAQHPAGQPHQDGRAHRRHMVRQLSLDLQCSHTFTLSEGEKFALVMTSTGTALEYKTSAQAVHWWSAL